MADYIKREDALDIVADNNVTGEITLNRYDKIIDGIYDIPSADVAPVRHGRWISINEYPYERCSICGETHDTVRCLDNYCPNCGAHMMDGDADD